MSILDRIRRKPKARAAEKQEWQREIEQYRPLPMPTIFSTNVCTCPDVYALLVSPPRPCPVHAHLWNVTTTTNTATTATTNLNIR